MNFVSSCLFASLLVSVTVPSAASDDEYADVCPYYTVIYNPDLHTEYGVSYADKPYCANFMYSSTHPYSGCNPHDKYRTLDGTCNNLKHPLWGSNDQTLLRWLAPDYDDKLGVPRLRMTNGELLPLARAVSVLVHDYQNNFHPSGSVFLMEWGQFLSHDIATGPSDRDAVTIPCCDDEYVVNMTLHPDIFNGGGCFPIIIPEGDRHFTNVSTRCINFIRSKPSADYGVRQQLNQISSYIDGSVVYGPNNGTLSEIREYSGGRLLVKNGDDLPEGRGCRLTHPGDYCLKAGDFRVNMFPPLGALHTIFMRYHNYLVAELAIAHPYDDDETLFQEARRIVIALLQHITYDEYLPLILGKSAMKKFGLSSHYRYNPHCDATIHNAFSAAVFRFGHSMVPDFVNIDGIDVSNLETWLNPHYVLSSLDSLINGSVTGRAEAADRWFSLTITDRLFERRAQRGRDLVSINIQRGRDHGLPSYNNFRRFCDLDPIQHFDDLPNGLELRELYNDVEDIDLYTGAMSESRGCGPGSLGPTFTCLLARQFRNIRDCDRFWWESDDSKSKFAFTDAQREAIGKTSLSEVICLTTGVAEIQKNAFKVNRDRLKSCARLRKRSMDIQGLF